MGTAGTRLIEKRKKTLEKTFGNHFQKWDQSNYGHAWSMHTTPFMAPVPKVIKSLG